MNKHAAVVIAWGSLFVAARSFALPPSTPQYLLNQQVQSNNYTRYNSDAHPVGRGGIPVLDAGFILKMKQDAWKEWNASHGKSITFNEWEEKFNKGDLN